MIHTINSQLDMRFIVMTIYKASYRMHIFTILCCNCPLYQPNSLFCNSIIRLDGDHDGRVYLLCTEGVAEFNFRTEEFK